MSDLREDLRRMIAKQLHDKELLARLADPSVPILIRGSAYVPNADVLFAAIPAGINTRAHTLVVCKPEHVQQVEELLLDLGYRA